MRFEDYVVARRRLLIDHAIELGCDTEGAATLVDTVLEHQRRRIERETDPDPTTYAAVQRAVVPPRPVPWRLIAAAAVVVAVGAVAGGLWWVLRPPPPITVPSFYALDASAAGDQLRALGLRASLQTVPVCEPGALVVGTTPGAGERVEAGTSVRLRSAVPPGGEPCRESLERAEAWDFVHFVLGGPAPAFDDTVFVVLDGREPAVLPAAAAADSERWAGIGAIARSVDDLTRGIAAYPLLVVSTGVPPPEQCGIARPASAGQRKTLRLQVVPRRAERELCPLTVDLYRDADDVIDAVVIYQPS